MTRSPGRNSRASGPVSTTSPAHSMPRMSDAPGGGGYIPCRCRRSARLSAVARTRMRTSAGPSAGRGASPRTSTVSSPGSRTMMARMAISLSMARPGCQRYKPSVMTLAAGQPRPRPRRCRLLARAPAARGGAPSRRAARNRAPARGEPLAARATARGDAGAPRGRGRGRAAAARRHRARRAVSRHRARARAGALPAAARPVRARRPHAGRVQRRAHPARTLDPARRAGGSPRRAAADRSRPCW